MDKDSTDDKWSYSLQTATRKAIENLEILGTLEGGLPLKHIGGAFGTISLGNLINKELRIVDRHAGTESVFETFDALIVAGWVID
jgi:hypothetical protein